MSFVRLPRSSFLTRPPHFPCLLSAPACPDPDVCSLSELLPDSCEGRNVREGLAELLLTFHQRCAHTYAGVRWHIHERQIFAVKICLPATVQRKRRMSEGSSQKRAGEIKKKKKES